MSNNKSTSLNRSYPHRHGWDCFRTSGGYTNAMENSTPLSERIETIYKTAYKTGYRNGLSDGRREGLPTATGPFHPDLDAELKGN